MKNNLLKFFVFGVLMLCGINTFAQFPGTEDTGGTGNLESTDQGAPINDFIIYMFVFGSLLSFYLIHKNLQKKISPNENS